MDRINKVNSLLFHELNSLLTKELTSENKDKFLLSFTKVETTRDLRIAKVFYLVFPAKFKGQALKYLNTQKTSWQNTLNKKLVLKYKPRISFVFDKGQENAFLVEEILKKI